MKKRYILISFFVMIAVFIIFLNKKNIIQNDFSRQKTFAEKSPGIVNDDQKIENNHSTKDNKNNLQNNNTSTNEGQQKPENEDLRGIVENQQSNNLSETKTIGPEGGRLEITLSNQTKLGLTIAQRVFKQNTEITLSESAINPYRKNDLFETLALFEISSSKEIGTFRKGEFLSVQVTPKSGVDLDKLNKLQALVFVTEENGQQYWKDAKAFSQMSQQGEGIEIYFKELGIYKIEYSNIMSPTKTEIMR